MKVSYIYTLADPRNGEVRYVGKTNNPASRKSAHNVLTREVQSWKKSWVRKLKSIGLRPVFEIVDTVPESEWKFWEKYWISQFKSWGFRLTNHTCGGDGSSTGNSTSFKKGLTPWNKGNGLILECLFCSKSFKTTAKNKRNRKFCSRECAVIYNKKNNLYKCTFKNGHKTWNNGMKGLSLKPKKNVHQYNPYTGEYIMTWPTARAASIELKINEGGIGHCCRGVAKSAGGYIWSYDLSTTVRVIKNAKLKIK